MICIKKLKDIPCIPDPTGIYRRLMRKAQLTDCYRGKMSVVVTVVKPVQKAGKKTKSR